MGVLFMLTISCKKVDNTINNTTSTTVTDIDGNVYKIINIGTQTWMAQNLRTTKYRNGEAIPNAIVDSIWPLLISGAYCSYENTTNIDKITSNGMLYNWYAVSDSRNIAPSGWHIPTDAEWTTLITYLGGDTVAGRKLKETGTLHWQHPNDATNETSFTAFPSGLRKYYGLYDFEGILGCWWTSSEFNTKRALTLNLIYYSGGVNKVSSEKYIGLSVRCLRD